MGILTPKSHFSLDDVLALHQKTEGLPTLPPAWHIREEDEEKVLHILRYLA